MEAAGLPLLHVPAAAPDRVFGALENGFDGVRAGFFILSLGDLLVDVLSVVVLHGGVNADQKCWGNTVAVCIRIITVHLFW